MHYSNIHKSLIPKLDTLSLKILNDRETISGNFCDFLIVWLKIIKEHKNKTWWKRKTKKRTQNLSKISEMLLFQVTFELKQPWLLLPPLYYMKIQFFKIMFFISFVLTVQFTVFAVEKISFSFFLKTYQFIVYILLPCLKYIVYENKIKLCESSLREKTNSDLWYISLKNKVTCLIFLKLGKFWVNW